MKTLLVLALLAQLQYTDVLKDKEPVAQGICSVKGNEMVAGGVGKSCVMFTSPTDPAHVWFAILEDGEVTMIFEGTNATGQTKLIWWKGKRST